MYICYVDESGDAGTFDICDVNLNPLFVITGLIINHASLVKLTHDFLKIKSRFFPKRFAPPMFPLDGIKEEIKGNILRKHLRGRDKRSYQQSIGYIDACIRLLKENDVKLLGKALVKALGKKNSDEAFYGRGMMHIYQHFNSFLELKQELGFVIADGRRPSQNEKTTHVIFTQLHKSSGNSYQRIVEIPVYGQSNNFAMLQMADMICSAVVFPMLMDVYGNYLSESGNKHISPQYSSVRSRYKPDVKNMQYRYQDSLGVWRGGLMISDGTGMNRNTSMLFK
ncbi:MAG: DUF3800 domain-containing protein [Synergistaceae bacterium]|nr:DUF3800 domain-containing protein [Synergistaceae bacterium]